MRNLKPFTELSILFVNIRGCLMNTVVLWLKSSGRARRRSKFPKTADDRKACWKKSRRQPWFARRLLFTIRNFTLACGHMRLIGHLPDEPSARTFGDFLYARGIQNQLEHQKADGWGIWVAEEDKIGEATDLLALFRANPGDPKYRKAAKSADQLRAEEEKDQTKYRQRVRERTDLFRPLRGYGFGPLTCVLIAVSVVVGVLTR